MKHCVLLVQLVLLTAICGCTVQSTHDVYPRGSCPANSCLTLLDVVSEKDMISSNSLLTFYPGDHILINKTVHVINVSNLTLQAYSRHSGSGYLSSRVVCINSSFSFYGVSELSVVAIHFVSCRSALFFTTSVFHDTRFENSTADYGGALAVYSGSSAQFMGSTTFVCNSAAAGGSVYAETEASISFHGQTVFADNFSHKLGGALFVNDSCNIRFAGKSTFKNNSAVIGGALTVIQQSSVIFDGTNSFVNNWVHSIGGAVYADSAYLTFHNETYFRNNYAHISGGALQADFNSVLTFDGFVSFRGNFADEAGGALCTYENNTFTFNGKSSFEENSAVLCGGALYASVGNAIVFNDTSNFKQNRAPTGGGAIDIGISNVLIFNCNTIFAYNEGHDGGAVNAILKNRVIFNGETSFVGNRGVSGGGALIGAYNNTVVFNSISKFQGNEANIGGALCFTPNNTVRFNNKCRFKNNTAYFGGAVYNFESNVTFFSNSILADNTANCGGAIYAVVSNVAFLSNSTFEGNTAYIGGAFCADKSNVKYLSNSNFEGNKAATGGGAFYARESNITFLSNSTFEGNRAAGSGGAFYVGESDVTFLSNSTFEDNTAEYFGGALYALANNSLTFSSGAGFVGNSARLTGGAVYLFSRNEVVFQGTAFCVFEDNSAEAAGGGVYAFSHSNSLIFDGCVIFSHNRAQHGGGMFILDGEIHFEGGGLFLENNATRDGYGGALLATGSYVHLSGSYHVRGNTGGFGGAFAFVGISHYSLIVNPPANWVFDNNFAHRRGGAIFVQDNPFTYCFPESGFSCFFQLAADKYCDSPGNFVYHDYVHTLRFNDNRAVEAGNTIYGGSLDACFPTSCSQEGSYALSQNITNFWFSQEGVSSDPYKVCSCNNNTAHCDVREINLLTYPGQDCLISLVAVGQMNGAVPSVIRAVPEGLITTSDFQFTQPAEENQECSQLQYPLLSQAANASLKLYSNEPCSLLGEPLTLTISFLPCPVGFTLSDQGNCICDERLLKYTQECIIQNLTISREDGDSFWVGVENRSESEELILHPHCPFDYCTNKGVSFQLNGNGTDLQCANCRSGVLCGVCQSGYSLALGSSRCLPNCYNEYLVLLLAFALAGVILVGFLFLCHLTVAEGTLSGLIFYANILAVNQSIFFPSGSTNPLTVFIAWLNLDLGIETCFFKGLDVYTRTWLQFAFPVYIWVMVGVIIYFADTSTVVAKVIGRTNPVAVLATLFLLSYTKLLQAVMVAFSFTTLSYPNDDYKVVWLYDGNIGYLDKHDGRHIALFLFSLLVFLLIFLPYSLLLFSGQWILSRFQLWWISPTKQLYLKAFLDAYYAPFTDNHRYWTGLLLLIRFFILLLTTVVNIGAPQDPFVRLVVLLVTLSALQLWVSLVIHRLYKKWYLDVLEASFTFNLMILIGGTYQIRLSGGNQSAFTYTSVSVAFATFIGIVTAAFLKQLARSVPKRRTAADILHIANRQSSPDTEEESSFVLPATVTCSVVEIVRRHPLEPMMAGEAEMRPLTSDSEEHS